MMCANLRTLFSEQDGTMTALLMSETAFASREELEQLFACSVVIGELWSHCGKCSSTLQAGQLRCHNCDTRFGTKIFHKIISDDPNLTAQAAELVFPYLPLVGIGSGSVDAHSCALR